MWVRHDLAEHAITRRHRASFGLVRFLTSVDRVQAEVLDHALILLLNLRSVSVGLLCETLFILRQDNAQLFQCQLLLILVLGVVWLV